MRYCGICVHRRFIETLRCGLIQNNQGHMAMVVPEGSCNRWQKESDKPKEELDLQKYLMHLKRRGIPFISMEKDKKVTITPAHREYTPAIFNENGKRC